MIRLTIVLVIAVSTFSVQPALADDVCCGSVAAPVVTAPAPTVSYYAPTTSYYAPATSFYAPTTAYYAPATNYVARKYYVAKPVIETVEREERVTVRRPVIETVERE
ncbi:MAG TPA: hypothetical protein VG713_06015, partial [Pirellulales bacterium]|nr:hypothetical protein [Pirellulales bacterium]